MIFILDLALSTMKSILGQIFVLDANKAALSSSGLLLHCHYLAYPLYPILNILFTCHTAWDSLSRIMFLFEMPSLEIETAAAVALKTTFLFFFFLPPRFLARGSEEGYIAQNLH